jgi:two-component system sensor histidine kinase RpfC
VLASWQIPVVETATAVEAVARLVKAAARGAPFEILIVEGLDDAATYRVLDLLEGEPEIAALGVLLVLEPGRKLRLAEHYRNAVYTLEEPVNTAFLFNALHAFQGSRRATTDVISLFERVAAPQLAGRPLNILVADDNAINRMLIGRILDRAGHRHLPVANGREALEALESSRFDLVVIDMRMPDIGGLDTFKMFRFAHPTNETPFIMVTADATTGTRQACAEAGIGHFLTKPISAERLLAAVEEAYRPGARRDEGPREPTVGVAAEAETVDARLLQDIVSLAPDEAFLARLLQNFLDDSRALLETMGRALEAGDDREFEEAAHALKGAAANFALPRLSSLAYGAEQLAGEALGTEGPRSLASLRNELDRSTEALRRALPGTQAAV